jgi:hypothetical protein
MQVFINATHSRTHDYHILGRIYSNMGGIAHMASEFPVSYRMYERSGEMYLRNKDTLLYYYDLNNMAFEKAMLKDKEAVLHILNIIENECKDSGILIKILETKAELYLRVCQYDSALYFASELCRKDNHYPIAKLIKAQVYSYWEMKDSAVYYAEQVLHSSSDISDIQNSLYILTNDNTTEDVDTIKARAADRSDVQQIVMEQRSKLSQATQLLTQDLSRKPDMRWLYAVFATILIIGITIRIYISRKRKEQKLLAQKIDVLKQAASAMQEKHDELTEHYLIEQKRIEEDIKHTCLLIRSGKNIAKDLEWGDFEKMCDRVDRLFYLLASKLRRKNVLNKTEIRLCVLVLLDMSRAEIADTLPYALSSIGKLKDNTAKLLGTTGKNLHDFLVKMAIEG